MRVETDQGYIVTTYFDGNGKRILNISRDGEPLARCELHKCASLDTKQMKKLEQNNNKERSLDNLDMIDSSSVVMGNTFVYTGIVYFERSELPVIGVVPGKISCCAI